MGITSAIFTFPSSAGRPLRPTTAVACVVALLSTAAAPQVVTTLQAPPGGVSGQPPIRPSSPASGDTMPVWSRVFTMPDGRPFVTDGGLAIDAAVAKPATMPQTAMGARTGELMARNFLGPYQEDIAFGDLRASSLKNTLVSPKGVFLNGNYVTYLRGVLSARRARLRMKGPRDPVVVLEDGIPVAILMPVAPPAQ